MGKSHPAELMEPKVPSASLEPEGKGRSHAPAASQVVVHESHSDDEAESFDTRPKDLPKMGLGSVAVLGFLLVALLAGLFLLGYLPHRKLQSEILADAAAVANARPVVGVASPQPQNRTTRLVLPAEIQPFQQTAIYSRANGYLKTLLVDIGDRVQAGQLLAEIDTPEIDAQLERARAAAQEAQANVEKAQIDHELAELTFKRYENINPRAVTQQQVDEARATLKRAAGTLEVAKAAAASARADVRQLEALQSFQKVSAPFAGVITARNYDIGALVSNANSGAGKELFRLDRTDTLRVFVKVPQSAATAVQMGQKAELQVRNYPGRSFEGKLVRSTGSLDATTRTLRVEIHVPNPEGALLAGMYGQVELQVTQPRPPLLVPTSAMIYNAEGLSVATVKDGIVHLRKVSAGRDLGTDIEILEGLVANEQVITNPSEDVKEGSEVSVVAATPGKAKSTEASKAKH